MNGTGSQGNMEANSALKMLCECFIRTEILSTCLFWCFNIMIQRGSQSCVAHQPEACRCVCLEVNIHVFSFSWSVLFWDHHCQAIVFSYSSLSSLLKFYQREFGWLNWTFSTSSHHVTRWLLCLCCGRSQLVFQCLVHSEGRLVTSSLFEYEDDEREHAVHLFENM